jgi:hypothetical protein
METTDAVRLLASRLPKCDKCGRIATKVQLGGWGEETGKLCDNHGDPGMYDNDVASAIRALGLSETTFSRTS